MLAAGRAAAAAVDRYLLPTWCSAANWPWLWSNDGTDRRMDGWTRNSFIDPAQHYYASSVNKHFISTQETAITSPLLNSVSVAVGPAVP